MNAARCDKTLRRLIDAFEFVSPRAFRFAGRLMETEPPPASIGAADESWDMDQLTELARLTLYQQGYARPFRGSAREVGAQPHRADPAFIDKLSRANRGLDRWEEGWRIYEIGGQGRVFLEKGDRFMAAPPGHFLISGRPGTMPRIGDEVSVRLERESLGLQSRFMHFFSETPADQFDEFSLIRFYFHVAGEGAPTLVERLTKGLNRYQVPYLFKCLDSPKAYDRTDAATLYTARRFFHIAVEIATEAHDRLGSLIHPETPLFAKPLLPGLAVADDPGERESFGMHRCRLTAEGLLEAWRQGSQGAQARLDAISARFARDGFDLGNPHLNPGSLDIFAAPEHGGPAF